MLTLQQQVHDLQNSGGNSSRSESAKDDSGTQADSDQHSKVKVKKIGKTSKQVRVEQEKARQLKVMKDKLYNRGKCKEADSSEESSEEFLDMKALRKKMTRKQKEACKCKVSARLKKAGAYFPEESTSASSGTDSSDSGRKVKGSKVKSGAKVKKRPVVRTELWPHTIANEEDGGDITSENISLSKFLSCFTSIMTSYGKREATGRTELLHAITNVLECFSWAEARAFHNIVMIKLEQGRLDWSEDFSLVAETYLDKKVRLSLKSKGAASGSNSYSKTSFNKNFNNKGFSFNNNLGRSNPSFTRNKSLYAVVCRQWNYGTCGFGDKCRKWHVCWSCAEAGKPGELHRATSHDSSAGGGDKNKPRI